MSGFGERLRKLRRASDVTQGQLADFIGVVTSAVGKYEAKPNAYPSVESLIKIAQFFNVSTDYLLLGVETNSSANNSVSGDLKNSTVIHQASNSDAMISREQEYSFEAMALMRVYENLDMKDRLELLNFAFSLDERMRRK
ncbi:MAG: helix-turn-helix transcriptional regulator [Synergistaceae bacterium]|nr:helix-turn-helix transcriptional regulator [Synergistaceae bacterium]